MIEQTVYTVLSANTAVQAIVGAKIYPLVMPEGVAVPALVYQKVGTTVVNSLEGFSGIESVRLQFSCYAPTLLQAKQLALAVSNALDGAAVLKSTRTMELDGQDPETKNFRVVVDFNIWQRS
jgi:hypothetical protein